MQEKGNHIKCHIIQNLEMHTTNIYKCILVKSHCTHFVELGGVARSHCATEGWEKQACGASVAPVTYA